MYNIYLSKSDLTSYIENKQKIIFNIIIKVNRLLHYALDNQYKV